VTARIMPAISLISPKEKRLFSARVMPRAFVVAFSLLGRVAVARCIARHRFRVIEYTVRYKFFISPKPPFTLRNSLHAGVNILRPSIRALALLREVPGNALLI